MILISIEHKHTMFSYWTVEDYPTKGSKASPATILYRR